MALSGSEVYFKFFNYFNWCPLLEKYALSIYHYNIQFVAGDEATYHRNVKESFEKFLDLISEVPVFKTDIELQAHYIEFLAEHYPEVLEKLKRLVKEGRVELVSAHYSDQIYVAYPRLDLEKSIEIGDSILAENGLKRSNVFFTQENYFTPSVTRVMKKYGYNIAVVSLDYYNYFYEIREEDLKPFYKLGDIYVVTNWYILKPLSRKGVEWVWLHYGDGEPSVASGGPYKLTGFRYDPEKARKLMETIKDLSSKGFKFVTISEYVKHLIEKSVEPGVFKETLEGAWSMDRNYGVYLWMGIYKSYYEKDSYVRALTYKSRKKLLAAETLVKCAKEKGYNVEKEEEYLKQAWKEQLLAEVSDSTGWGPTFPEVGYSILKARMVLHLVDWIVRGLKEKIGFKSVLVDTGSGEV